MPDSITPSRTTRLVSTVVIPGGAAGTHRAPGVRAGDEILAVTHYTEDLVTQADLTAEFTSPVVNAQEVDNTLGTATTGDFLAVTYIR